MSIFEFKNSWDEAVRRAMLARRIESELADPALARAAGLPARSGIRAGVGRTSGIGMGICASPQTAFATGNCMVDTSVRF